MVVARGRRVMRPKVTAEWAHIATVESDTFTAVAYEILRHPDGRCRCGCMAFVFSKAEPKICKHILAIQATEGSVSHVRAAGGEELPPPIPVTVDGEQFTVTRGIAFGRLTAQVVAGLVKREEG